MRYFACFINYLDTHEIPSDFLRVRSTAMILQIAKCMFSSDKCGQSFTKYPQNLVVVDTSEHHLLKQKMNGKQRKIDCKIIN